jgi:integrase/recombinase XerD
MINDQLSLFDKWQKSFINEKKVLNMSKSTLMNYSSILNKLYDYYAQHEDKLSFYEIDRDFVLSFLNNTPDMATNTKNLHITVIKNFFKYVSLHNKDNIDYRDRFTDLVAKAKKSEPTSLDSNEYEILQKHLNSKVKPNSFIQYRNRLALKLLLFTGVRASEVLGIKLEDFFLMAEESVYKIKILGKGNKERYVYISIDTIANELQFVKDYIENINQIVTTNHQNICSHINQTTKGRVMLRSELYTMIENFFKKLHIKKRGVHLLRHTFGKKMVQKNVNLSTIKELMGHENIQTTMIYAQSDEGSMIRAVKV